jgi:hypothetical protein
MGVSTFGTNSFIKDFTLIPTETVAEEKEPMSESVVCKMLFAFYFGKLDHHRGIRNDIFRVYPGMNMKEIDNHISEMFGYSHNTTTLNFQYVFEDDGSEKKEPFFVFLEAQYEITLEDITLHKKLLVFKNPSTVSPKVNQIKIVHFEKQVESQTETTHPFLDNSNTGHLFYVLEKLNRFSSIPVHHKLIIMTNGQKEHLSKELFHSLSEPLFPFLHEGTVFMFELNKPIQTMVSCTQDFSIASKLNSTSKMVPFNFVHLFRYCQTLSISLASHTFWKTNIDLNAETVESLWSLLVNKLSSLHSGDGQYLLHSGSLMLYKETYDDQQTKVIETKQKFVITAADKKKKLVDFFGNPSPAHTYSLVLSTTTHCEDCDIPCVDFSGKYPACDTMFHSKYPCSFCSGSLLPQKKPNYICSHC